MFCLHAAFAVTPGSAPATTSTSVSSPATTRSLSEQDLRDRLSKLA